MILRGVVGMSSGYWGLVDIEGGKRILDIGWGLLELVDIKGAVGMSSG